MLWHLPFLALSLAAAAAAQTPPADDLPAREAKLRQTGAQLLLSCARTAESNKQFAQARATYELVVAHYDAENKAAKTALARPAAPDQGNPSQQRSAEQAWTLAARKLGPQHRDLGIAFLALDDLERGQRHLELALRFDPNDVEAHKALGHAEHNGFYGTDAQIAFCWRLAAIDARAKELAATNYEAKPLGADALPEELRRSGLVLGGAKSRNFTIWTTSGGSEVAADVAAWGERAIPMLEFLLGNAPARHAQVAVRARDRRWIAVFRTPGEWNGFFAGNPQLLEKLKVKDVPPQPSFTFEASAGLVTLFLHPRPLDADTIVAHVTMWGFANGANEGLGQGLVHTMTSLLVGTMNTWFGAPPPTVASPKEHLPRDPKEWAARIREEIRARQDWPVVQVPRERLSSFRENVRVKSWSFVLWLAARHPDRWTRVFLGIDSAKGPLPEAIDAVFRAELGRSALELEAEWREWAGGDSAIAKATGRSG